MTGMLYSVVANRRQPNIYRVGGDVLDLKPAACVSKTESSAGERHSIHNLRGETTTPTLPVYVKAVESQRLSLRCTTVCWYTRSEEKEKKERGLMAPYHWLISVIPDNPSV